MRAPLPPDWFLRTHPVQVQRVGEIKREQVKAHLEGSKERDGSQCEGTAAKGRRGGGRERERRGGEAGDLTHVVKVEEEKKGVMGGSSSKVKTPDSFLNRA